MPAQELIDAMLQEGQALGKVKYEKNGVMKWEFFIGLSRIHVNYATANSIPATRDLVNRRRAAYAEGNTREWFELAKLTMRGPSGQPNFHETQSAIFRDTLLKGMKVPIEVYQKTVQEAMSNEE